MGVGTTYDTRGWMPGKSKAYLNHVTITAYEPGKRFAFDALDPKGAVVPSDFALTPAEGGTRLRRTMSMSTPSGAPRRLVAGHLPGVGETRNPEETSTCSRMSSSRHAAEQ